MTNHFVVISKGVVAMSELRSRIRATLESLPRVRPIWFLCIYLSIIPIFALCFCLLPANSFYAPYLTREHHFTEADIESIKQDINFALLPSIAAFNRKAGETLLIEEPIELANLTVAADGIVTDLYFRIQLRNIPRVGTITAFKVRIDARGMRSTNMFRDEQTGILRISYSDDPARYHNLTLMRLRPTEGISKDDKWLFGIISVDPSHRVLTPTIRFSPDQEERFTHILGGFGGDPSMLSGFFLRMLYFSAITITTVGYGDIIPLTAIARMLVAVEAVMGWTLAGLFLNGIAQRAQLPK